MCTKTSPTQGDMGSVVLSRERSGATVVRLGNRRSENLALGNKWSIRVLFRLTKFTESAST
jgi:hypothetical protein